MESKPKIAGEQLRLARLAHGYSLEEVGALIGATRQFIHQLETGSRSASEETVVALADVLGVTPIFLSEPIPSTVRPEQCHFRGHITRPASVTSQVLARGTLLDRFVAAMELHVDLPEVSFPDMPAVSSEQIEVAAEEARRHWGLGTTAPVTSMMRVVENAGAIVTYFGDLSDRVDAFSMDRRRPIIVRSSLKESLCRQRFDFAHECGHLIMHRGLQTGDRETEGQAHRFASAFLFPRGAFLREFPRNSSINWRALYDLKLRWKMSVRAIVRRAYDLKVLNPAQYRTANIHLVKSGQAKIERFDDDGSLPVEQPELLVSAVDVLDRAVFGGAAAVGEEVGLQRPMLELITGTGISSPDQPFDNENVVRLRR
ncbi:XRE family transcriptional regulator [Sphingopyxis sp. CCNWLW253]|uniref:helix-turn-helix domain-containing protein n=1 Tax=unclassified Sphingopyxis TaxID=2614943 RepID=UPI003012ABB2